MGISIASAFAFPRTDDVGYSSASPFPHAVFKNAWDEAFLSQVEQEVSSNDEWDGEKNSPGSIGKRWSSKLERLPASVQELISLSASPSFLTWLEELTGEVGLIPDPYLQGGGIHSSGQGAFLKMHADFNWHQKLSLYRRLNVILYLNRDWSPAWGGDLRLANQQAGGVLLVEKSINPDFNTMVIFTTDENSFHGHPDPIACPVEARRNSIALYYYSATLPAFGVSQGRRMGTDYRAIDGHKLHKRHSGLKGAVSRFVEKVLR